MKLKKVIILMKEQVIDVWNVEIDLLGYSREGPLDGTLEYCRHWYHPKCTNFDVKGKSAEEIACTPWVCKYC